MVRQMLLIVLDSQITDLSSTVGNARIEGLATDLDMSELTTRGTYKANIG